jgi:fibronectin-binding autotransporter adhesin
MRNYLARHTKRRVSILFSVVAALWLLGNSPTKAQDLTWNPAAADTPNNWFTAGNWLTADGATAPPPTTTESASVNGALEGAAQAANIAGAAVANQLLVGATNGEGGVALAPLNNVNIGGIGASLTLSETAGQVSLDVVNGTVTVANGGALVSSGSQVGAIGGATQAAVTVTGAGSTWTENGTLDIGTGSIAAVTVEDGASFQGTQPVTIEPLGTLIIGDGVVAGTFNAPAIVNNDFIEFDFANATTLGAQISGTGSVEMDGGGIVTLTGNNSYSGDTTIFDGTVIAAATNALGASFVDVTGATSVLQINPGTSQTNIVQLSGGATLNNFGALSAPAEVGATVTVFSDGSVNNGFGASITNTGGVAIQGDVEEEGGVALIPGGQVDAAAAIPDPVIVTNAGTISGTEGIQLLDGVDGTITNASTGVVTGTSGTAIDAALGGTVTLSNAGVIRGNVVLAAFPNTVTLFTGSQIAGNLNLGDAAAAGLILDGTGTASLTQAVTGALTNFNSLTKQNTGTWTIDEALTYAGGTNINGGTLVAAANNALGTGLVTVSNTGLLSVGAGVTVSNFIQLNNGGSLANTGTVQVTAVGGAANAAITTAGGASVTNVEGATISGLGLFGIQSLSGSTTVTNAGTISGTEGIQLLDGADGTITNASTGVVTGTGGTAIDAALGGTVTLSNAGVIRGNVVLAAFPNTVTLLTGSQIAGNLNLGDAAAAGLILDGTGTASLTQAVTGAVTNFNSLIKQNTGTWTIDEALTYSGGTNITGGTLVAAANNALGTGLVTVSNTGLLSVGAGVTVPNFIQLNNGGSLTNAGTVQVTAAGAASNAAVTTAGGASITNVEGATISGLGLFGIQSLSGSTTVTNAGAVSGTEGIDLVGGGTVSNISTGRVTGSGGLAVAIGGSQALLSNAGLITGNVELNALTNTAQLFTGEKIAGNLTLNPAGTNQLILDGVGTATISQGVTGTITNVGSLTKQGSGTWIIDRPTSASAAVNVDLGTLQVDSKLAAAVVNVQQNATLKGTGVINLMTGGTVFLAGALAPGDSPGIMTINGNYVQSSSGTFNVLILSPTDFSQLVVTGHATLAGTLKLTLGSGYVPAPGTQFAILRAVGGISGQFQNVVGPQGRGLRVTYSNGLVDLTAESPKKVVPSEFNLSDGTPSSTTALMANSMFYDFGPLSQSMAESGKDNTVGISFDAGTFTFEGHHGEEYGFPITGGFKINDRTRLDYEIPLEYVEIANTALFQAGLTLELPMKVVIPTPDQHFSWDVTPAVAVAAAGSREVIGAGALTNVFAYRFPAFTLTYGNYISVFEGDTLSDDDQQFPIGVDQRILKNGLKVTVPFGKGWVVECYGIYTEFLRTAPVSSYVTAGFELGRHFVWNVEGKDVDLGYLSLGLYTEQGNRYSSGHVRVGSAWRF